MLSNVRIDLDIHNGYVRTSDGTVFVQIGAVDSHCGFILMDDDQEWPGGIGVATEWRAIRAPDVSRRDRVRLRSAMDYLTDRLLDDATDPRLDTALRSRAQRAYEQVVCDLADPPRARMRVRHNPSEHRSYYRSYFFVLLDEAREFSMRVESRGRNVIFMNLGDILFRVDVVRSAPWSRTR